MAKKATTVKKKEISGGISTLFGVVELPKETEENWGDQFNIWSFVNSISESKNYVFDDNTSKDYTPFTINRAFSIHIDTLNQATLMNRFYNLDKKMQHDYYFYSVNKKVRRKKWLKKTDEEKRENKIIEDTAVVIGYNFKKTKEFLKTLSVDDRQEFVLKYVYPDSKNKH